MMFSIAPDGRQAPGHSAADFESPILTHARAGVVVKVAFAGSLVAALFLSVTDIYTGIAAAMVFVMLTILLDYWLYRRVEAVIAGSRSALRNPWPEPAGAQVTLTGLLDSVLAGGEVGGDGSQFDGVRADLARVGDLNSQLMRLEELRQELDSCLPYDETKTRVLRLTRRLLGADVVALISEDEGHTLLQGLEGCEADEVNVGCCPRHAQCPVRAALRTGLVSRVPDHECSMFQPTLRSQLSLPFVLDDEGPAMALVAAAARTHAFDETNAIVLERLTRYVHSALWSAGEHDEVRRQAVTDAPTGLYNRRFFEQRLGEEIDRSVRDNIPMSLLMLSLSSTDRRTNTSLPADEEVVRGAGRHLAGNVRESDECARYGSDEFALLLTDTPGANAVPLADRLRINLSRLVHTESGLPAHVAVTVIGGIASCPRDATDAPTLLRRAREAQCEAAGVGHSVIVRAALAQGYSGDRDGLEVVPSPEHQGACR